MATERQNWKPQGPIRQAVKLDQDVFKQLMEYYEIHETNQKRAAEASTAAEQSKTIFFGEIFKLMWKLGWRGHAYDFDYTEGRLVEYE